MAERLEMRIEMRSIIGDSIETDTLKNALNSLKKKIRPSKKRFKPSKRRKKRNVQS
jgi:hypothetical protein